LIALGRKGGDLVTPGIEKDDYGASKKNLKKKRGRKNKYYRQIDAEDDEEADQMSDGSDDGLDGIKEEDEEDDEEKAAKLAKMRDLEEQARLKEAEDDWLRMLRRKVEIDELLNNSRKGDTASRKALAAKKEELRKEAQTGDKEAKELHQMIEDDKELRWRAKYHDPDAIRKLKDNTELAALRKRALYGDPEVLANLEKKKDEAKKAALGGNKNAED